MSKASFSSQLLAATLFFSLFGLASPASGLTAMQPGTNWGNTLDAVPSRHSWGAPEAIRPMIQKLVDKGCVSPRIPIIWNNYLGPAPDYAIAPAFMAPARQVVDWSPDAGLYVMSNLPHASGWLHDMPAHPDVTLDRFLKVWMPIATLLNDYPDRRMYESIHEPDLDGLDDPGQAALLHEANTAFHALVLPAVYTKLAERASLKRKMGKTAHPEWHQVMVYYAGLTLNGNATLHGIVTAPEGLVTIDRALHGRVSADRLTTNGSALLEEPDSP